MQIEGLQLKKRDLKVNEYTCRGSNSIIFLSQSFNPIALRKAKIVCNFGLSECNRVKSVPKDSILFRKMDCSRIETIHIKSIQCE